jgi:hypothetical protein
MNDQIENEVEVKVRELEDGRLYAHLRHGDFQRRIESPQWNEVLPRGAVMKMLEMACESAAAERVYEVATGLRVPKVHVLDGERMVLAPNYEELAPEWDAFQAWTAANPVKWVVDQPDGFGFMEGENRLATKPDACLAWA